MRRAEELSITLPDSLVLSTALTRMSEALAKCGGTQVSYRIASMRQELSIDLRPTMMAVRDMAEYLEAEAEELSLLIGGGSVKQTSGVSGVNVGIKAMTGTTPNVPPPPPPPGLPVAGHREKRREGGQLPCKFWGTNQGCKKGDQCGFAHNWDGVSKNNRCFFCSAPKERLSFS